MKEEREQQNGKYIAATTKSAGTYKPVVTLLQKFQAWIRPRESSFIDIREQKLQYSAVDKVETRWPQQPITITDAKAEELQ